VNSRELLENTLCCIRCGRCRGVTQERVPDMAFATQCPCGMTFYGAYEPAGLMYCARGIAQGTLSWSKDLAKVLYACTLCGYCDDLCQRSIRYTPAIAIIEELRRLVPDKLKPARLKKAADTVKIPGNHTLAHLKRFGIHDVGKGSNTDTLFFPDHTLLRNTSKLKEVGYILQRNGAKVGCLMSDPLPPVSADLLNGGCQKELDRCMAEIDKKLSLYGVKTVIVYNPESLSVLKRFTQSSATFISIARFLADVLRKSKVKKVQLPPVTYQDPCHLGRYAKEYAAPRKVIAFLGLELKEMWRTRENGLCCGAGGGVLATNPPLASTYAAHRWHEVRATGAQVMVTACPNCYANFTRSRPRGFKVVDLTSLAAEALGYRETAS
jgi:Fe-S oxidoreductase